MTFSRLLRARVIAGVVGSLCLVVGDVLITPLVDFGDKTLIEIQASITASRLDASGLRGALPCCSMCSPHGMSTSRCAQAD
jgi:hypothetical protein